MRQKRWEWFSLLEMRDLVGGEVVEHEGRREDEPPGEAQAPLAEQEPQRLLVSRTVMRSSRHAELGRVAPHRLREVAAGLRARGTRGPGARHEPSRR